MKSARSFGCLLAVMLVILLVPVRMTMAEPSSSGDGLMPYADVLRLIRWIDDGYADKMTYEDVAAFAGTEGLDRGNMGPNSMTSLGDHYFDWIAAEDTTHYIHVCFRGREATGRFECCQWNTSGFRSEEWENADLTDWLIANACLETEETTGTIQRFSNPAVTVTAQVPVRGWEYRCSSNRMELIWLRGDNTDARIQVVVYDDFDMFDFYIDQFENIAAADSRNIAGLEMQGRSYHYMKKDWLEYTAALCDRVVVGVLIPVSVTNLAPGTEGCAVLDSLSFECTDADGVLHTFRAEMGAAAKMVSEKTTEPTAAPLPAETPVPAMNTQVPEPQLDQTDLYIGRRYTALTYEVSGYTLPAATLGTEYSLLLNADGTADLCLGGTHLALTWVRSDTGADIDYYGAATLKADFSGEEILLDYMDAMLLHMRAE